MIFSKSAKFVYALLLIFALCSSPLANAKTLTINVNGSQNWAMTYLVPQDSEDERVRFELTIDANMAYNRESTVI